jgi:replicative DNA helicase
VLWAEGEALMICAPPGAGKTTLGVQVVSAMCGIDTPEVLGLPVRPAGRVLYLAMDRPKQIQRAMGRIWGPEHERQLTDRLFVWKGPLPFDLAADARGLHRLAEHAHADVVVIDSLKDAAVQLTDDRTAGMVNRAVQTCLAEGVDVLVLHHQRKGQNGEKPKRLEDVYGSTWITAGMGSVVLLWGQAGDPLDHVAGRSSVHRGFDLDRFLDLNPNGVTAMAVARAMTEKASPTDTEHKKALRLLDAAAKRGRLVKREGTRGGVGGSEAATYHRAEFVLIGGP